MEALLIPLFLVASKLVDQTGEQDEDVLHQQSHAKPAILLFWKTISGCNSAKESLNICLFLTIVDEVVDHHPDGGNDGGKTH